LQAGHGEGGDISELAVSATEVDDDDDDERRRTYFKNRLKAEARLAQDR
jgi:hypothetical protein